MLIVRQKNMSFAYECKEEVRAVGLSGLSFFFNYTQIRQKKIGQYLNWRMIWNYWLENYTEKSSEWTDDLIRYDGAQLSVNSGKISLRVYFRHKLSITVIGRTKGLFIGFHLTADSHGKDMFKPENREFSFKSKKPALAPEVKP